MTEADIYLVGIIALALLCVFLLIVVRFQARDLDQAARELDQARAAAELAERRCATMRRLHQRQQVWIRRQRVQLAAYRDELDAVVEATRPIPVEEDLETEVRRTLDALPVAEKPQQSTPEPESRWKPFLALPPANGCAIYPRPTKPEEQ